MGLALINHDGEKIRCALLVLHAKGLTVSVDAPQCRDLIYVRDLQRPRCVRAGSNRHAVDAGTQRHNFTCRSKIWWIAYVGRITTQVGAVGKGERARGDARQLE